MVVCSSTAKYYMRCDLAKELYYDHGFPKEKLGDCKCSRILCI